MAGSETRRRLAGVGVFILPVLIVKGTGALLSPADVSAQGAGAGGAIGADQPGLGDGAHEWSEQQLAAARYVTKLADQPFGENPLYYKLVAQTTVQRPVQQTDPKPVDPKFNVTAVMKTAGTTIALVDGKMRRAGDTLHDGAWTITAIDQGARSVTFTESATGRTLTKNVPLPE